MQAALQPMTDNPITMTDSYKASHWLQYPPDVRSMYSYFESRGGRYRETVFFGLQYYLPVDNGKIWVDQDEITDLEGAELSKVRRKMGFLFQDAALFDSLTLYENLALPLERLTRKSQEEIDFAVDRVLSDVGLAGDKAKMPSELSGGMRKRAGLARALVLEPKILLADEPASGLDRITASEIDELLLKQKAEKKTTLIVVKHDVHGARRVADQILVLDRGKPIAQGTVSEIEHSENDVARKLIAEV